MNFSPKTIRKFKRNLSILFVVAGLTWFFVMAVVTNGGDKTVENMLHEIGFSQINLIGYRSAFACRVSFYRHTGIPREFTAVNAQGKSVSGFVCYTDFGTGTIHLEKPVEQIIRYNGVYQNLLDSLRVKP